LKLIYKNHEKDQKQREKLEKVTHFWFSIYFFINNISLEKKNIEYKDIYKKYLGNDYDFDQKDFSLYISNHLGYLEIATYMKEYAISLLITFELLRTPAVGGVMAELGSFFVDREDAKSREKSLETLVKRQKDFYNKKSFVKTLIFPEGTTTNGKYIATFKKGAFISLLPLKPLMVFYYDGFLCSTNRFCFFLRTVATIKIIIKYAELPVIKPTDYMFDKYKHLGNEKWEIYAKVVNKIYSEIGGFKQTNIRFRDRVLYYQAAEDGFFIDK
jgi:lysophosphatidylcholine acyltransferase/lyso-PAF acetyltransferase